MEYNDAFCYPFFEVGGAQFNSIDFMEGHSDCCGWCAEVPNLTPEVGMYLPTPPISICMAGYQ